MDKITMLGTGHAMTFDCFNTCFVYENENGKMLVDTGGGKQLLQQFRKTGINASEIDAVFISHRHTDHMMGLPWLFRTIGGPAGGRPVTMYLHTDVYRVALGLVELLFPERKEDIGKTVRFVEVRHGDETEVLGRKVRFVDLNSPNVPQFGFVMELGNGERFIFHGDVPFDEANREEFQGVEIMMHEAFNLAGEKFGPPPMGVPGGGMLPMAGGSGGGMPPMPGGPGGGMPPMPGKPGGGMPPIPGKPGGKPGKMGHSTVKDAAGYAQSLGIKTLILVHGNDNDLLHRKEKYIAEASGEFVGTIYAPDDFDVIELS